MHFGEMHDIAENEQYNVYFEVKIIYFNYYQRDQLVLIMY